MFFCLTLSVFSFAGGALAQTPNAQPAIAADGEGVSDRAIQTRLEKIFKELEGLQDVSASVRSGVVTLRGVVNDGPAVKRAEQLAIRVDGVVAVTNELTEETSVSERLVPVYERLQNRLLQAVSYLPLLLVALFFWGLVGFAGYVVAGREWPWSRLAPNAFIADLMRQFVRILFIVVGAVLALDILGATALLGTLLGAAGIVGLAVGFAVRDTVENYIASILLSIRQPFRPKDFIKIGEFDGFVISLTSRATILMEADGNHIRIPNATVFKSTIINYSTNPHRRFSFELGVDPDSDLADALQIGLDTLSAQPFILDDPEADAWIGELGDSNVLLVFAGWIDQRETDLLKARSEAIRLVKGALEAGGIALPEPVYRLRFDPAGAGEGASAALRDQLPPRKETPSRPQRPLRSADKAQDTTADRDVEKKVEQERNATGAEDLLDEKVPDELGRR
nr:mechanosensitive ion channel family protein [Roseibium litorale]